MSTYSSHDAVGDLPCYPANDASSTSEDDCLVGARPNTITDHSTIIPHKIQTSLVFEPVPPVKSDGIGFEALDGANTESSPALFGSATLQLPSANRDMFEGNDQPSLVIYAIKSGDDIGRLRAAAEQLGNHTCIIHAGQATFFPAAKKTTWLLMGQNPDVVQGFSLRAVMPGTLATDAEMYEGPRLATLSHSLFGGIIGALMFFLLLTSV